MKAFYNAKGNDIICKMCINMDELTDVKEQMCYLRVRAIGMPKKVLSLNLLRIVRLFSPLRKAVNIGKQCRMGLEGKKEERPK